MRIFISPSEGFIGYINAIYKAVRYGLWRNISDEIYYRYMYYYYKWNGDRENATKIKMVYSIHDYSMVGRLGLLATHLLSNEVEKNRLDGCFVECGVARGGCSALMAMVSDYYNSGRKIWLFDSFEGLPEPRTEDKTNVNIHTDTNKSSAILQKGFCLGTYEEVNKLLFCKLGLNSENIIMVKGWFQDTLPIYKDKIGKISFLRLDGDWYESTKCCLNNLYDNVVGEGYILIDDYHLPGCKQATNEFLQKRGLIADFTYDGRGGVYFKKPHLQDMS